MNPGGKSKTSVFFGKIQSKALHEVPLTVVGSSENYYILNMSQVKFYDQIFDLRCLDQLSGQLDLIFRTVWYHWEVRNINSHNFCVSFFSLGEQLIFSCS